MTISRASRAAVAAGLAATVLLGGCTNRAPATLPPLEAAAVADTYDDTLAELGLRLTDRGGLVDQDLEPDPDGTHLSLYVAPLGPRDDIAYVEGLVEVTAVFAEDVFERWPDLESFDVCQEGVPQEGADSAPARTQVTLTREAAASVDWSTAELADVLAATQDHADSNVRLIDSDLRAVARDVVNR